MTRLSKVRVVASFELRSTLRRKGYLIATFGMPVFVLLYGLLISTPGYFAMKKESEVKRFGIVDESAGLGLVAGEEIERSPVPDEMREALGVAGERVENAVAAGSSVFVVHLDIETARRALLAGDTSGYYVIPPDYLASGSLEHHRKGANPLSSVSGGEQLRSLLRDRLLAGRLPDDIAKRSERPIARTVTWVVGENGEVTELNNAATIARIAIPGAFALFLFVSLMMTNGYLLQATATEKENRVVEVLLSSTNPDEILFGKLLGLGAAGLFQMFVWFSMLFAVGLFFATALVTLGVELPWGTLAVALLFFVAAYLFLGSLSLATGSLGGNVKESQQWSAVWTILTVVPLMFVSLLLMEPHGALARTLTWIPFTAPLTVLLRMAIEPEGIAAWEIAGALLVMVISVWLAIRLGARLFRVGLMMGSRPKLREILRQARLSSP